LGLKSKFLGEVLEGTAEALPAEVSGIQFDVVLLLHVLEHCIESCRSAPQCEAVACAGGHSDHRGAEQRGPTPLRRMGQDGFFADIPRHLQFLTESSLRKALEVAGMRAARVIYTGYTAPIFAGMACCTEGNQGAYWLDGNGRGAGSAWPAGSNRVCSRRKEV